MDTEALRISLLSKFREVTSDRLEKIGLALLALEQDATAAAPAEDVARELHTMKGESRMLGLPRIGELAHACEDVLKASREGRTSTAVATDLLLQSCDLIGELLDSLELASQPHAATEALCASLTRAASAPLPADDAPKPAGPTSPASPPKPESPPKVERSAKAEVPAPAAPSTPPPHAPLPGAGEQAAARHDPATDRSIRVAVDALEGLGALTGDLLVEGARSALRASELAVLVQRINRLGDRFIAMADLLSSRLPHEAAPFAQLESDLHLLRDDTFRFQRQNSDGVNALRTLLDRLAGQIAEARLVPLSTVFAAFPRAVRDIARQQSKDVELTVENAEVGVDRGLLGDVRDAMVHLLRNAVDHGIEPAAERQRRGKPAKGHVSVAVRAEGDMLVVELADDGRGIDPRRLRDTAVSRGLLSAAQAAALSEREAFDLIFLAGFSTRDQVTDLSGRGVGMAVVKKKIEALGGSVAVTSRLGAGTRFNVRLPQSMALMRVLLVQLGNDVYGIPAADVLAVGRIRPQDRVAVAGREAVDHGGRATTLVELSALLRMRGGPRRESPPCVFVQYGEDRAALVVDGFVGEREVAVKRCGGEFLKGAPFVAGAAALEDGRVAVLLHVPDVMLAIRKSGGRDLGDRVQPKRLRVLMVDDSPIARATESALVRALGHQVDEAIDGEDGLAKLALQPYDLIFSDVQMPKMDGIEFTRRIKGDPATASIPVVILSSLAAPEDQRRGLDAGADAYLVKGELSAEGLAQTIGRLVS